MTSEAYDVGHDDGLAWDLDGFSSWRDVEAKRDGWHEVALARIGRAGFCRLVGIAPDASPRDFAAACADYDRGAHAGACAPQSHRFGFSPTGAA